MEVTRPDWSTALRSLGARDRTILKDIIHTYITSGRPVSSRAVSKHGEHGLSAASIRNVMADLEEAGLLQQPHTSAGRIPTQAAYRLYVESLMQAERLATDEEHYIEDVLRQAGDDADELMAAATELLSELSHQAAVVVRPAAQETILRTIDFVKLGERRVLCVIVSTAGFIENVVVSSDEPVSREDLQRITNFVNERFAGFSLQRMREELLRLMAEDRARVDQQLLRTIQMARGAVARGDEPAVLVKGTSTLLDQPELADVARIQRMLETFGDKARLVTLLNRCLVDGGVRILIGTEDEVTSKLDFSLVGTCYGIGSRTLGTLGILGPSRMEYARLVALVHYLARALSRSLADSSIE